MGVEAVWTPKGFRLLTPAAGPESELERADVETGRAGYGGTDTSPPGTGYGVGRSYD